MNPDDTPADLPPHPEEYRLRRGERDLATTIRGLSRRVGKALDSNHPRHRVEAATLLAQLANVAVNGQQAMVRAIQDQMGAAQGETPGRDHESR